MSTSSGAVVVIRRWSGVRAARQTANGRVNLEIGEPDQDCAVAEDYVVELRDVCPATAQQRGLGQIALLNRVGKRGWLPILHFLAIDPCAMAD